MRAGPTGSCMSNRTPTHPYQSQTTAPTGKIHFETTHSMCGGTQRPVSGASEDVSTRGPVGGLCWREASGVLLFLLCYGFWDPPLTLCSCH